MRHQPGVGLVESRMQFAQHADPDLDVAPLGAPNLTLRAERQMRQIAILDADQVRLTQREVEVELDQSVQRRGRVGASVTTSEAPASSRVLMPTNNSTRSASLFGKCR